MDLLNDTDGELKDSEPEDKKNGLEDGELKKKKKVKKVKKEKRRRSRSKERK